jgi:hypothetical protein
MNRSLRPLALTALLSILALVARPAISALQGPAAQDSARPSVSERI